MKISKIKTVYFSPCGATKSVAEFIGKTLAEQLKVPNENISYTLPAEREKILSCVKNKIKEADFNDKVAAHIGTGIFGVNKKNILSSDTVPTAKLSNDILLKTNNSGLDFLEKKLIEAQIKETESFFKRDELVIWASPVYAGRIPNKTLDFVKEVLKGNGTLAIPVVVFGNRNFDNALAELTGIMKDNGLRPIAGAAIVTRHAFNISGTGAVVSVGDISPVAGASYINATGGDGKMSDFKTSSAIVSSDANERLFDYEKSSAVKISEANRQMSNYKMGSIEKYSGFNVMSVSGRQMNDKFDSNSKITETGDRPSELDFEETKEFCMYVANCIKTNHELKFVITAPGEEHPAKYYTPLKEDGTPANFLKAKPRLNPELCVSCGICSEVCPMGSIEFEHEDMFDFSNNDYAGNNRICCINEKKRDETDYVQNGQIITNEKHNLTQFDIALNQQMDGADCQINNDDETQVERHPKFTGICIKCQACIRNCPSDALYFDDEEFLSHVRMIKRDYLEPKENCFIC